MCSETLDDRPDGMLLFRELLRYFGGAYVEEYYRNGSWDTELLELDLELLRVHHRQAGKPKLKSLEEIPEVELPEPAPPPWRTDAAKRAPVGRGTKRRLEAGEKGGKGAVKQLRASKGKGKGGRVLENAQRFPAGMNGKASGKLVPPPPPLVNGRKGMLIPKRISYTTSKASGVAYLPGSHTTSKAGSGAIHIPAKYGMKGSGKSLNGIASVYSKASGAPAFSKTAGRPFLPLGGFAKRSSAKLKASKEVISLMNDPDFLD